MILMILMMRVNDETSIYKLLCGILQMMNNSNKGSATVRHRCSVHVQKSKRR